MSLPHLHSLFHLDDVVHHPSLSHRHQVLPIWSSAFTHQDTSTPFFSPQSKTPLRPSSLQFFNCLSPYVHWSRRFRQVQPTAVSPQTLALTIALVGVFSLGFWVWIAPSAFHMRASHPVLWHVCQNIHQCRRHFTADSTPAPSFVLSHVSREGRRLVTILTVQLFILQGIGVLDRNVLDRSHAIACGLGFQAWTWCSTSFFPSSNQSSMFALVLAALVWWPASTSPNAVVSPARLSYIIFPSPFDWLQPAASWKLQDPVRRTSSRLPTAACARFLCSGCNQAPRPCRGMVRHILGVCDLEPTCVGKCVNKSGLVRT